MSDIVERLRSHVQRGGGAQIRHGAWDMMLEAADEIERLMGAVTKISYMDCQCGEDAMKMRNIATDAVLWHKPNSMWWHLRTDGPPRPEATGLPPDFSAA